MAWTVVWYLKLLQPLKHVDFHRHCGERESLRAVGKQSCTVCMACSTACKVKLMLKDHTKLSIFSTLF